MIDTASFDGDHRPGNLLRLDVPGPAAADRGLWDALPACRKRLADERGVPPYVVFHGATLMQMLEYRPSSEEQLNISGKSPGFAGEPFTVSRIRQSDDRARRRIRGFFVFSATKERE